MQPELSIIIPAYNEADAIEATIRDVSRHLDRQSRTHEIIVVADGTDGTRERVRRLAAVYQRIQVAGSPHRQGKGKGVRTGVQLAQGKYIGFLDADNKVPIDQIERILPRFHDGLDIVFGSRNVADSQIAVRQPWFRRLGSRGFGLVMHALVGLHGIRDTQCGFKFFRHSVAKDLFQRQVIDGYMFDVEILYLAEQAGYRLLEVGVRWRDDGDSRLNLISGNWNNLMDLFQIRFRGASAPRRDTTEESPRRAAA